MVLHRLYRHRLVSKRHYLAVGCLGGNLEAVGKSCPLHGERMVAHRLEALRKSLEDALPVVAYAARLAVHKRLRADDPPAERLGYRLVSETDAEDRDLPCKGLYRREGDSSRVWIAGARGYDERVWLQRRDSLDVDLVVPEHLDVDAKSGYRLDEVVGERIVVVYQNSHTSSFANSAAWKTAFDLFIVSWYSFAGSESATIPAPARIVRTPFSRTIVRITIAKSMSPV